MNPQHALDALRHEIGELVKGREEWLDTLVIGRPDGVREDDWVASVRQVLFDLRLDAIELEVESTPGAPWIRGSRFTEGWSP